MTSIFYVDDDYHFCMGVADILELEGYEARTAGDGQAALDLLRDGFVPDLIVCNIIMPRMNGYEFLRWVKEQEHLRAIPFVFASALNSPGSIARGLELGADDYLVIPFDAEELLTIIQKHLQG